MVILEPLETKANKEILGLVATLDHKVLWDLLYVVTMVKCYIVTIAIYIIGSNW